MGMKHGPRGVYTRPAGMSPLQNVQEHLGLGAQDRKSGGLFLPTMDEMNYQKHCGEMGSVDKSRSGELGHFP